ncbi:puromycin-sensitive aminopeptidase [Histomonas meleagridis]|uniref:puromycin-sensitive aminopeptidase n=1 Tax=Histomonas meleagridis TaxID=135588 RepID=UPI00355A5415|nr:puromycin-sensitive aminopeptidase [Histomonas meleagridis]KAH0801242.1 puromycin-sensitive aminopeptidase [Histomonas meleagridis]
MSNFRLSLDIIPLDYSLNLTPNIRAKTFAAVEIITFQQNKPTEHAELFAHNSIKIKSIEQNNKPLKFTHENGRLTIYGNSLAESPVKIEYDGALQTNSMGWYYVNDECCSTQFEATHARECFPCFDEPTIKSTFQITINIPSHLMALSNMPVKSVFALENNIKSYTFHQTPKMCTYLLALAVGDFDVLTGYTKRGMPVEIYAVKGNSDLFEYPLAEAIQDIDWYEDFIGVKFPLPKLQCLAVPEFQFGAMENYGLLTFRETTLLAKPGKTPIRNCRIVALDVAHELAHQWCGDSVSPKFWDSVWLNEGFATIFPYILFEETHPEWDFWSDFISSDLVSALSTDASSHTHPIHCNVKSEEEIESVFDSICYSKAGCVIRMLMKKVGNEGMRKVLRSYFSEFQNKNADTDDLCNTFTRELGYDLRPFFDAWTKTTGYPVVILEDDLTLHQIQYTNKGLIEGKTWPIPLTILRSKNGEISEINIELNDKPIKLESGYDWIKVNTGYYSFCRTWHKGQNLTNLLDAIKSKKLPRIDRWAILNDQRALAKIGVVSYADVIKLLENYSTEEDFLVANEVVSTFSLLLSTFVTCKPELKALGRKVLSHILNSIGREPKDNEPDTTKQLRTSLLIFLTFQCEDSDCITYGKQLYEKFKEDYTQLDPNLLAYSLRCGCLHVPGAIEYVTELSKTNNPMLKACALQSLGTVQESRIPEILQMIFRVNSQDILTMFRSIANGPNNTTQLWNFLKENYSKLFEMFKNVSFNLAAFIQSAAGKFNTIEQAEEVEEFFKKNPTPIAEMTISQVVENIRIKAEAMKRDEEAVKSIFK